MNNRRFRFFGHDWNKYITGYEALRLTEYIELLQISSRQPIRENNLDRQTLPGAARAHLAAHVLFDQQDGGKEKCCSY